MLRAWHKADVFNALQKRGWAGPNHLEHPSEWFYVGEAWSFSRGERMLSLYLVADYGTGFHGPDCR